MGYNRNSDEALGKNLTVNSDERRPVEPVAMCHCGQEATARLQMTTHECKTTPMCDNCLQEIEWNANEVNQHEMENFGGAYGLVAYEVLPL